jgi:hypothetical protein
MKRAAVGVIVVAAVIGGCVYFVIAGRTNAWPTTQCEIVSSRVVRADGPYGPLGATMVLYKGEYQLRYRVNHKDYLVWVNAGWLDKDREFVESKVSAMPASCPFTVRYNPKNPSESATH